MKLIIAGGRDYRLTEEDYSLLDEIHRVRGVTEVVCGMCSGADMDGYAWAVKNSIYVAKFYPDWDKYGKASGPIRNREMAEYGEALIAFKGGKGTANMISEARKRGLIIFNP